MAEITKRPQAHGNSIVKSAALAKAAPLALSTDPVMHVAVSDASLATHRPNEEIVPGIKETGEVDMEVGHGRRFVLPIDGLRVYRLPPTAEWGAPAVTCSEPGVSMA
jgi:hypothetical protein